jgi:hypothetical protein
MVRFRVRVIASALLSILVASIGVLPAAAGDRDPELVAYLDGKEIPLSDVGLYHCDDLGFPVIRCSVSPLLARAGQTLTALLSSADYVTIYDGINYSGSSMTASQDYATLLTIGWNDRVSSFKARNSATGKFWTDWMYGGSYLWFCCNQSVSSLGSNDNIFSSLERT